MELVRVISDFKNHLSLEHAHCESLVMSDSTNVQNYYGGFTLMGRGVARGAGECNCPLFFSRKSKNLKNAFK